MGYPNIRLGNKPIKRLRTLKHNGSYVRFAEDDRGDWYVAVEDLAYCAGSYGAAASKRAKDYYSKRMTGGVEMDDIMVLEIGVYDVFGVPGMRGEQAEEVKEWAHNAFKKLRKNPDTRLENLEK